MRAKDPTVDIASYIKIPPQYGNALPYILKIGNGNKIVAISPILANTDPRIRNIVNYEIVTDKGFAYHPASQEVTTKIPNGILTKGK